MYQKCTIQGTNIDETEQIKLICFNKSSKESKQFHMTRILNKIYELFFSSNKSSHPMSYLPNETFQLYNPYVCQIVPNFTLQQWHVAHVTQCCCNSECFLLLYLIYIIAFKDVEFIELIRCLEHCKPCGNDVF